MQIERNTVIVKTLLNLFESRAICRVGKASKKYGRLTRIKCGKNANISVGEPNFCISLVGYGNFIHLGRSLFGQSSHCGENTVIRKYTLIKFLPSNSIMCQLWIDVCNQDMESFAIFQDIMQDQ